MRYCKECNCRISNKSVSGLCRACNIRNVVKSKGKLEEIPDYVKQRFYQIKNRNQFISYFTVRDFWEMIQLSKYKYKDGDKINLDEEFLIIERNGRKYKQEVKEIIYESYK